MHNVEFRMQNAKLKNNNRADTQRKAILNAEFRMKN